ncbi:PQQ-binding-like beta-propeller repeat protein [Skermania sp. ID1734]|nr:PQQ-binding-like beta-propeller repeat protein [Skermania sp. ID1734]
MGRITSAAFVAILCLLIGACGAPERQVDEVVASGWPAANGDARNSNTSTETGSRSLALAWMRPIGGTVQANATIADNGQVFVTSNVQAGCNLFSFQMDNGRKRFCDRLTPGVAAATPLIDGDANAYLGQNGSLDSYNEVGQPRWHTPVLGTPISAHFTGDGNVLYVTQLGQIDVVSRQTGHQEVPPFALLGRPDFLAQPNTPLPPNDQGITDCFVGGAGCPVAKATAIDPATGKFYVTLWRPGAKVASLVALRYDKSTNPPQIRQDWSADNLTNGPATAPALSADGHTVYITDNTGLLIAMDTKDGRTKWTHNLGYVPLSNSSVSSDGLIIPGGGRDGHLIALRDRGDSVEVAWERDDLVQRGVPVQTSGNTGYTVVRAGANDDDGLALLTFDTATGKTLDSDVLPDARGTTIGTAIGPRGEVVVTTLIGELFTFK